MALPKKWGDGDPLVLAIPLRKAMTNHDNHFFGDVDATWHYLDYLLPYFQPQDDPLRSAGRHARARMQRLETMGSRLGEHLPRSMTDLD
jgi:hypothetical protein